MTTGNSGAWEMKRYTSGYPSTIVLHHLNIHEKGNVFIKGVQVKMGILQLRTIRMQYTLNL